jgi:hypothetical protein
VQQAPLILEVPVSRVGGHACPAGGLSQRNRFRAVGARKFYPSLQQSTPQIAVAIGAPGRGCPGLVHLLQIIAR